MDIRCIISSLALFPAAWCVEPANFCQPSPEVATALEKAETASTAVTGPFAALDRAAPFLAVRDQYPDSLFAHQRYQDAIHEYGIEGHLQLLDKQYAELESKHKDNPMYHYLVLRAMVGRNTPAAIRGLDEILAQNPDFAPAHQTLAEIYGTEAFRQPEKERSEKEKYLAACPGGTFTKRPPPIPEVSTLLEQAERLLAEGGDPDKIIEMTYQGLRELNWRSQRIRAFDWYSRDYKIQDARQLRLRYWQAWPIEVRCHRKAGRAPEANQLLARLERELITLRAVSPGPQYWNAVYTLAQLSIEGGETDRASQKLNELQELARDDQDPAEQKRLGGQLEKLRATVAQASR